MLALFSVCLTLTFSPELTHHCVFTFHFIHFIVSICYPLIIKEFLKYDFDTIVCKHLKNDTGGRWSGVLVLFPIIFVIDRNNPPFSLWSVDISIFQFTW